MTITTILIALLVLALVLPLAGIELNQQMMRLATIVLVIALLAWLFYGRGAVL